MKKIITLLFTLLLIFGVASCATNSEDTTQTPDNPTEGGGTVVEPTPTLPPQGETENVNPTPQPTPTPGDDIVVDSNVTSKIQYVDIELDETYNISSLLAELSGLNVSFEDNSLVSYENGVLKGLKTGVTRMLLKQNDKEQVCRLEVHQKGALGSTFSFDEYRLTGKNIVAFGDSVTDYVTNNANSYYERFAAIFGMNAVKNYAIGGTTAHYGYEGSNLYKEYFYNGNWITDGAGRKVVDGVQRVKNAYDANELANIDYVFIAYTHNDQHFQPIPTKTGYNNYDLNSFASCDSFKGSYVHMIRTLKLANPDVRIILMAPTYAQYDIANIAHNGDTYYGKEYNYSDYRQMIKEVAGEENVKYVNSWNFLKDYYDFNILDGSQRGTYYNDPVHLGVKGQQVLAEYLAGGMSDWYLNGEFASGTADADYQFSKNGEYVKLNLSVTRKELGKGFVVVNNGLVLDANKLSKSYNFLNVLDNGKIAFTKEGEYVIKVNLSTNSITMERTADPSFYVNIFSSKSSQTEKHLATYDSSTGLYTFEANVVMWASFQFNYNGEFLSCAETTFEGDFATEYPGTRSKKLYASAFNSTFCCANSKGATYTFTYNPSTDKLTISAEENEVDVIPSEGLYIVTLYDNTTAADMVSKKITGNTFTVNFVQQWGYIRIYYNGILLDTSNTTFVNVASYNQASTNPALLYMDSNEAQFANAQLNYAYKNSDNTQHPSSFTFTYDAASSTLTVTHNG